METNAGVIRISLSDETPRHRDNFVKLVRKGYYDGLLFHRVIKDFMIQSGDPDSRITLSEQGDSIVKSPSHDKPLGDGGPGYELPAEFNLPWLYHVRGAVAAAREADDVNPEMRSSGSQFYIVYGRSWGKNSLGKQRAALEEQGIEMDHEMWDDYLLNGGSPHLDGTYTVFGHVIEGMNVVKTIQSKPTDKDDRPLEDIYIRKATVE
ncbi:MAG: peptidylprolyl isomerase [Bacteroidaceae bacterium]|nr:peptidylprolyl isomerase [Bacteroidaceae bacterium]